MKLTAKLIIIIEISIIPVVALKKFTALSDKIFNREKILSDSNSFQYVKPVEKRKLILFINYFSFIFLQLSFIEEDTVTEGV